MLRGFTKKKQNCTEADARFLFLVLLGREPHSPAEIALLTDHSFFGAMTRVMRRSEFFHAAIGPFFPGKRPMQIAFNEDQTKAIASGLKTHLDVKESSGNHGNWPQCLEVALDGERAQKAFLKAHSHDRLEYLQRNLKALASAPAITGAVNQSLARSVRGYAFAAGSGTPLTLEFYLNGKAAGECVANKQSRLEAADFGTHTNIGFSHDLQWEPEPGVYDAMLTVHDKTSGVMVCPPKEIFVDARVAPTLLDRTVRQLEALEGTEAAAEQISMLAQASDLPLADYDLYRKLYDPGRPTDTEQTHSIGILMLDAPSNACARAVAAQSYRAAVVSSSIDDIEADFILPLGGHDVLHPEALAWINHAAAQKPDATIIRFGVDYEASPGIRSNPVFVADFDPLILEQNAGYADGYAVRANAVPSKNDFPEPSDLWASAWNTDGANGFTSVPHILLTRHEQREATALEPLGLPNPHPGKLAIIIPTKNRLDLIKPCVESLQKSLSGDWITEIIIVDNGSDDEETKNWLSGLDGSPNIRVLSAPEPFNWASLNNKAAASTDADLLLFLNDDTKAIEPGWDTSLRSLLSREDIGIVGAKLLYGDNTIQHAGVILKPDGRVSHEGVDWPDEEAGYENRLVLTRSVEAVTGAFLACTRATFDELGGFDAENFPITYNDIDFCLRANAADRRVVYSPLIKFFHLESQSRGFDTDLDKRAREKKERARFLEKWSGHHLCDRFFQSQLYYDNDAPRLVLRGHTNAF